MKIFRSVLICLLGFCLSANAQTKNTNHTLLWEISGKGLTKPSYLFGTYHFAGRDFIDTMKVLNDKLKSADAIVGELIIDEGTVAKLTPYMVMKNNFLDKLLDPAEYDLVATYLKKLSGYNLNLFNSLKPAAVQVTLLQFTAPKTFSATNPPIDQYFQDYGKNNHKKLIGLETVEDQAEILFGSSLVRQKELLIKMVKNEDQNQKEAEQLYAYYIAQDLDQLEKLFLSNDDYSPEEMDKLLKHRNQRWIDQLPTLMQNQSLFIAVGAGHLLGNDGLIKGLQLKGYQVKALATN